MKQEQEPERLGAAASHHSRAVSTGKVPFSLLFSGFLAFFQLHASQAGLSGAELSLPPQEALQSASLFPKQSLHPFLLHPCSLCLSTLMSTSCAKLEPCPQISSGYWAIFLGQK